MIFQRMDAPMTVVNLLLVLRWPKIGTRSVNLFGYANLLSSMHSPSTPVQVIAFEPTSLSGSCSSIFSENMSSLLKRNCWIHSSFESASMSSFFHLRWSDASPAQHNSQYAKISSSFVNSLRNSKSISSICKSEILLSLIKRMPSNKQSRR